MSGALAGGQPLLITVARAGGSPQLQLGDLLQARLGAPAKVALMLSHSTMDTRRMSREHRLVVTPPLGRRSKATKFDVWEFDTP